MTGHARRAVQVLLLALTMPLIGSCGGGGGGATGPITVSVSSLSSYVASQGSQQFTTTVANATNTAVTWQVNGVAGGSTTTGTISNTGLFAAPAAPQTVTITAVSMADASVSASTQLTVLPRHAVAVRPTASGIAEFYGVASGNAFTPRGNAYLRLAWQTSPTGQVYYHSTFNVGVYDASRAESAFAEMQSLGYNIVRVWLNGCCTNTIGNPAGGLSSAYIANVVDFLARAASHQIQVILTNDWVPNYGGYGDYGPCPGFEDQNVPNLCSGGVGNTALFFHDVAQGLISQGARLDAIFSYEIRSEYFYASNYSPLSWTSGTVTAADGQTYDMSSASSRQEMMDNGLVFFIAQVSGAIKSLDPTALVNVGFFWPQTPNPSRIGDPRIIEVYPAYAHSAADFADLHVEPALYANLTMAQYAQNYGFIGFQQQKPVIMGEFAAGQADYPSISQAATVLKTWQTDSCAYNFKGWLLFTWDTDATEQAPNGEGQQDWWATDGDGSINAALAPSARPDPCQ